LGGCLDDVYTASRLASDAPLPKQHFSPIRIWSYVGTIAVLSLWENRYVAQGNSYPVANVDALSPSSILGSRCKLWLCLQDPSSVTRVRIH